jgi:hypothetical protein
MDSAVIKVGFFFFFCYNGPFNSRALINTLWEDYSRMSHVFFRITKIENYSNPIVNLKKHYHFESIHFLNLDKRNKFILIYNIS